MAYVMQNLKKFKPPDTYIILLFALCQRVQQTCHNKLLTIIIIKNNIKQIHPKGTHGQKHILQKLLPKQQ